MPSFEALFGEHRGAVLRFAQRRLGSDAAWDVVSETFLAAWRHWQGSPATSEETRAWLFGIAGNFVRNQRRAGIRRLRLEVRMVGFVRLVLADIDLLIDQLRSFGKDLGYGAMLRSMVVRSGGRHSVDGLWAGEDDGAVAAGGVAPESAIVWDLPWPRNPHFAGRVGELAALNAGLAASGALVLLPARPHALGGVGLTQLAVEYCYLHAAEYQVVWWVRADGLALMTASLARLADRLGVSHAGSVMNTVRAVTALLAWGPPQGRWLLVLQDADAPEAVDDTASALGDWISGAEPSAVILGLLQAAQSGNGQVLVTSRDPGWSTRMRTLEVDALPTADAVSLLRGHVPQISAEDAHELAATLEGLPLALDQAGAFLGATGMEPAEYLGRLHAQSHSQAREERSAPAPAVAATWAVAQDVLGPAEPAVLLLAQLWAHFGASPIPLDLIRPRTAGILPPPLRELADAPALFTALVDRLVALACVRRTNGTVSMHRLTQWTLRDDTPADLRSTLRAVARALLAQGELVSSTRNPAALERSADIHVHALATGLVGDDGAASRRVVIVLISHLSALGDHVNGRRLGTDALRRWSEPLGEDHPDLITTLGSLGAVARSQGDYLAARDMFNELLNMSRRTLGENAGDTLRAWCSLASVILDGGDPASSREMSADLVSRARTALGEDHPVTLKAEHNLARALRYQGDTRTAREIFSDVLDRARRAFGEDDPDVLVTAHNLASTLAAEGDHESAREMFEDVLARARRVLGPDHPATLTTTHYLAVVMHAAGDWSGAHVILEDLLPRRRRVLGNDDPRTLATAHALASVARERGDYAAAQAMFSDLLARRRRRFGADDPSALKAAHNVASVLRVRGDLAEARGLFEDLLRRRTRVLGEDHVDTLTTRYELAFVIRSQGDPSEAKERFRDLLSRLQEVLGARHPLSESVRRASDELDSLAADDGPEERWE
ncbi:FxSxx-COOH system tetratricopeptide repeat protein [Pseudofrankia inefficax]|uniref:Sigma-70 region 2 domain protein n=1 Tax=Pseudofrankia inefficax (strain DSM 45817 / CECT 9037 / DDB 130130 / EuI1c) TaxID=298654 RepID=E3J6B1_PSEI1|nr:FxSxx-COOH system tetratricopeptide repeat protein [Pseudofrankia inefficax]ADP79538.1 sigma-70 region 2 domain protein [Pseudofrankia inefficax]